ncbi:hypothetical protein [Streptomyces sp. NPDC096339]|uniref:hypothetical protein n=1 Tax=Streptomyces sp. NPDC096339 TaxID=3366086 RepID=UPI0038049A2A
MTTVEVQAEAARFAPWEAQRTAFCASHGVAAPTLRLREIAHWAAVMDGAGQAGDPVHDDIAHLAPGYFYLPVSEEPDEDRLARLLAEAGDADWLLLPSVPGVPTALELDHVAVGFMPVAYFRVDGDLDRCLRSAVGNGQYKDIARRTRKAERLYDTVFHRLSDLVDRPGPLEDFARLQANNVAKYGHSKNLYTAEILRGLAASPAGRDYHLKLNRRRDDGAALYGSLSYADDRSGVFAQLVQGQDESLREPGLNLYITDYYQLYKFADELGFTTHCLGRGAVQAKRRLGANHVTELVNVLVPINTQRRAAMERFAATVAT